MRKGLAWIAGAFGLAAGYRALSRQRRVATQEAPVGPDPAVDLRRALAESRTVVEEREEFEAAETPVDLADPEARRAQVHEQGRAALEEMQRPREE